MSRSVTVSKGAILYGLPADLCAAVRFVLDGGGLGYCPQPYPLLRRSEVRP